MPSPPRRATLAALVLLTLVACTPGPPKVTGGQSSQANPAPARGAQTLNISIRVEPDTIAYKALSTGGTTFTTIRRAFNATIGLYDRQGATRPYLAAQLPQLGTESWRTFPDGRMETTYRLRDNLTWHDGTPVTSEDFLLAWRVYTSPQVGIAEGFPQNQMTELVTLDARSFMIRWRRPYPGAAALVEADFPPLPRHILEAPLQQEPDKVPSHPFWTHEYVGLGPYRLARWEPGAFIEATAFDGHVLGRPKIDRLHFIFVPDPNVALANSADLAAETACYFIVPPACHRSAVSSG